MPTQNDAAAAVDDDDGDTKRSGCWMQFLLSTCTTGTHTILLDVSMFSM